MSQLAVVVQQFDISNQTSNAPGKCTFPEDVKFKRDIPQTEKQFQIEEKFEEPKEILTADGTFRILASQTMIFKFSFLTKA